MRGLRLNSEPLFIALGVKRNDRSARLAFASYRVQRPYGEGGWVTPSMLYPPDGGRPLWKGLSHRQPRIDGATGCSGGVSTTPLPCASFSKHTYERPAIAAAISGSE